MKSAISSTNGHDDDILWNPSVPNIPEVEPSCLHRPKMMHMKVIEASDAVMA
jgi:hypothetical protein